MVEPDLHCVGRVPLNSLFLEKGSEMDTNQSYWASTVRMREPKVLKETKQADIVVVGAGLLGLSAAYHLNQLFPQKHIAIIEAVRVANGASGRNGGTVLAMTAREAFDSMMGFGTKRKMLAKSYRTLWEKTVYGLDLYQEIIDRHRIECGYSREGFLSLAASKRDAEVMARYAEAASEIGIPIRFLDSREYKKRIHAQGYFGALYYADYGQINPARYLAGLAEVVRNRGVEIYERSPVLRMEEGRRFNLFTPEGQVTADAVVLATNAYTPRLGYFKNRIAPLINPCAATEPLGLEKLHRIGWHATRGFDDSSLTVWYMGITEDYRIIVGGGDIQYLYGGKTSLPEKRLSKYRGHFQRGLANRFPEARDVNIEYVWTGPIDATLDLKPAVGVMGDHGNLYYGIGFTGEGVNLAHLSGKIIADLYAGNPEPWQDLYFVNRIPIRIPPEPVRTVALKTAFSLGRILSG